MASLTDAQLPSTDEPAPDPMTKSCPYCATDVPKAAVRCPHCTSELPRAA